MVGRWRATPMLLARGRASRAAAARLLRDVDGVDLLPVTVGRRKAFPNAAALGQGITEYARDKKALTELQALVTLLYI